MNTDDNKADIFIDDSLQIWENKIYEEKEVQNAGSGSLGNGEAPIGGKTWCFAEPSLLDDRDDGRAVSGCAAGWDGGRDPRGAIGPAERDFDPPLDIRSSGSIFSLGNGWGCGVPPPPDAFSSSSIPLASEMLLRLDEETEPPSLESGDAGGKASMFSFCVGAEKDRGSSGLSSPSPSPACPPPITATVRGPL